VTDLFGLAGASVVVTGAGNGIGRVYAQHLAAAGARVTVADLDGEAATATAAELVAAGGEAEGVQVDIADEACVGRLVDRVVVAFGGVDGLVNNAGLMSTLPRRRWTEIPVDEWDRVMAVNLRGMFLTCRAMIPLMQARGRGKVVNIASTRPFEGTPLRLHYTASKAGVVGFTRALAREVGADAVTVNAVAPGLTLSSGQVESSQADYLAGPAAEGRALPRAQQPDDLVGAVLFFLSRASDYITGQTLVVDGGKVMH
jgi:NAD(P)-dependent dehydrogenase (short-subunit alcohol dehydrogenase family)